MDKPKQRYAITFALIVAGCTVWSTCTGNASWQNRWLSILRRRRRS
jgi:hypothetical protein